MQTNVTKINYFQNAAISVRIRPFNEEELNLDKSAPIITDVLDKSKITVNLDCNNSKNFNFQNVFDAHTTQTEVFEKSSKFIIDGLFQGTSGTIMTYGQTGTGKTYTLIGGQENINNLKSNDSFENENIFNYNENPGILIKSVEYILDKINSDKKNKYNILTSYVRIHMEAVKFIF